MGFKNPTTKYETYGNKKRMVWKEINATHRRVVYVASVGVLRK